MTRRLLSVFFVLSTLTATHVAAQRLRTIAHPQVPGTPRISAEFPLSDPVYVPTNTMNSWPTIAAAPDQALVVWSGPAATEAVRVDSAGRALDTIPLKLPLGAFAPTSAVWDGNTYIVAGSYSGVSSGQTLRVVGVDLSGRVAFSHDVTTLQDEMTGVAIARHGSGELAIGCELHHQGATTSVVAVVATVDGSVEQQLTLGASNGVASIRVAASPGGYGFVWNGGAAVVALHGAGFRPLSFNAAASDLIWNGSDFAVVSADDTAVRIAHLAIDGSMTAPTTLHDVPTTSTQPAIAWNGSEYRVTWKEANVKPALYVYPAYALHSARVSAADVVLSDVVADAQADTTNKYVTPVQRAAIAVQGTRWIIAWTKLQGIGIFGSLGDVYAMALASGEQAPAGGAQSISQLLSRRAVPQNSIAGMNVLPSSARVFWSEAAANSYVDTAIRTATVDLHGARGGISDLPGIGGAAASASPSGTVLVWQEMLAPGRLMADLVDSGGHAGSPFALVSSPSGISSSHVACGTTVCAAVYSLIVHDPVAGDSESSYLQRFTPSGVLLDAPVPIPIGFAGLAARGDEFLLAFVWPNELVVSRFVEQKLSDVTILATRVAPYATSSIVSNGSGWLVAFVDTTAAGQREFRIFRVAPDGSLSGESDLALAPGQIYTSGATWDGHDWILVWTQGSADGSSNADVRAARITSDGNVVDPSGFGVAATVAQEIGAAVGSAGDGLTAVAYTRVTNDAIYGDSTRVFVRWIDNR